MGGKKTIESKINHKQKDLTKDIHYSFSIKKKWHFPNKEFLSVTDL